MIDIASLPDRALSIMQPWAWLIVNGHKDIENRDWPTKFRGPVCIHAGKKEDMDCFYSLTDPAGPFHPVTDEPFAVDTGAREIESTDGWATYSAPDWSPLRGGIVGVAEIVDCVDASDSPWFVGRYGFIIRNARPVEFIPVKGALMFFDWRKNL
ncbi:ASCH domain-containing protein [Mesorhizobium muleiense]|uniref:ASCH domain-containing protein n=1 Tax=Mesorhizobium muleiense TaxID=1004279 RepID=A0A1G9H643_9HYPH|nr:ASCH domain-containing protein [Mesorhizobium muleiense]SDL08352.1 ASCH domain-containing protein [Mesorhizobium muleiense]